MKEAEYNRLTYELTIHVAEILAANNTIHDLLLYFRRSTDSTEVGKSMWARVKGKTENQLLRLPFKKLYVST
jgi:hypothetical protein